MSDDETGYEEKQNDITESKGRLSTLEGVREGLSKVTGELRLKDEKLLPMQSTGEMHFW